MLDVIKRTNKKLDRYRYQYNDKKVSKEVAGTFGTIAWKPKLKLLHLIN
jgi:hypothetical protein